MKIDSATLSMQSTSASMVRDAYREQLAIRSDDSPRLVAERRESSTAVSISAAARLALRIEGGQAALPTAADATATEDELATDTTDNDPWLSTIRSMIEWLTGQPMRVFSMADLPSLDTPSQPRPSVPTTDIARQAGSRLAYEQHRIHEEWQRTDMMAEGVVRTADGQEIRFRLELSMERYYREESHLSLRAGGAERKDPLVVNFDGTAAQLQDRHFLFDLDNDGRADRLPQLAPGNGFLVFDRNRNDRADPGELFGPASGQGFSELALLDSDRNGWLDSADPVFEHLGILLPPAEDGTANSTLLGLADAGLAAIATTHVASPFRLRGEGGDDLGLIRASGLALLNDGRPLAVQELDLTVR